MENDVVCRTCVHTAVCEHYNTMRDLQFDLYDVLQYYHFKASDRFVIGPKLEDFDFIKTVTIECKYYHKDTNV